MKNYIFDSHVHSCNSFDGIHSIDDLCKSAIEKNINGFCITDHLEMNEYELHIKGIESSHNDMRKCIEKYKDRLDLRVGIEMGQPLQNLTLSEKVLKEYSCDFIIGSLHNSKNEKDFYFMEKEDFQYRIDDLLDKYYTEYYETVKWGKFDVIGHITYPLRYVEGIYKVKIDIEKYDEIIFEMLKVAVDKNIGIEINVSGFRQPYNRQFPELKHIKKYVEYGGEIITIGTDTHSKETLGQDFEKGKQLILESGLKNYCMFTNRKPEFITIY